MSKKQYILKGQNILKGNIFGIPWTRVGRLKGIAHKCQFAKRHREADSPPFGG